MNKKQKIGHSTAIVILLALVAAILWEKQKQSPKALINDIDYLFQVAQLSMDIESKDQLDLFTKKIAEYPEFGFIEPYIKRRNLIKDSLMPLLSEADIDMSTVYSTYFMDSIPNEKINGAPLFSKQEIESLKFQENNSNYAEKFSSNLDKLLPKFQKLKFIALHNSYLERLNRNIGSTVLCCCPFKPYLDAPSNFAKVGIPFKANLFLTDCCIGEIHNYSIFINGEKQPLKNGSAFFSIPNSKRGIVQIPYCIDYIYRVGGELKEGQVSGKYDVWVE